MSSIPDRKVPEPCLRFEIHIILGAKEMWYICSRQDMLDPNAVMETTKDEMMAISLQPDHNETTMKWPSEQSWDLEQPQGGHKLCHTTHHK